jgi:hypothetical protein
MDIETASWRLLSSNHNFDAPLTLGVTCSSAALIDIGRILRQLPPSWRPDRIVGPNAWHKALGYGRTAGFLDDAFHNAIHAHHVHVGFAHPTDADNTE